MFREDIISLLKEHGIDAEDILEIPPERHLGDYALPCFSLAKAHKKDPASIAKDLAGKLDAGFLDRAEAAGPYVNFFVQPSRLAESAIQRVRNIGTFPQKEGKVMVEYSQPNTHKAFHVGHLRGTSLGESLSRILRFAGHTVVQANYSGDTGAHIAKWLWYYTSHDIPETPESCSKRERWIADIYVKAVKELAKNPERQAEADDILRRIERGEDDDLMEIYKRTREWSIESFREIYAELHAHFDVWWFESDVEERGKEISRELVERGIAKVDDGAVIMDLEEEGLGVWVLLRRDGTALYSAKDLALAEKKFTEYDITHSIYVIGAAQSQHMRQLFETLGRMGFKHAGKCRHLSFAEVRLPDGKMSSRTGQNILYSDIRQEVARYAEEEVRKRHDDWQDEQIQDIVRKVTVAALKWDMLAIGPNKNITFDARKATEFEGETGPYVQYTYARACGILERASAEPGDGKALVGEKEQEVLVALSRFPDILEQAANEYNPGRLATYTMRLCKIFNSFYHDCQVIGSKSESDRLALVQSVVNVLGICLDLLAIDAPEEM